MPGLFLLSGGRHGLRMWGLVQLVRWDGFRAVRPPGGRLDIPCVPERSSISVVWSAEGE